MNKIIPFNGKKENNRKSFKEINNLNKFLIDKKYSWSITEWKITINIEGRERWQ